MTQPLPKTYATIRWLDDMDPTAADTASDLESLEQDVFHVLSQTLGTNKDDPNRGVGIVGMLGADERLMAQVPARLDAQLEDDARIDSSTTTPTKNADGTWTITVSVEVDGSVVDLNYQLGPAGLTVVGRK